MNTVDIALSYSLVASFDSSVALAVLCLRVAGVAGSLYCDLPTLVPMLVGWKHEDKSYGQSTHRSCLKGGLKAHVLLVSMLKSCKTTTASSSVALRWEWISEHLATSGLD